MTTMRELTIDELKIVSGGGTGSSSNNLSFREGLRGNPSTGWVKTGSNTLYLITVVGGPSGPCGGAPPMHQSLQA